MVTSETLLDRVKIDDLYFRATGGGICFGGGESLLHTDFIRCFREIAPAEWRITVETSLAVPAENVLGAVDAVDTFIVDCKDMDPGIYHRYTDGNSTLMTENLRRLLQKAGPDRILIRVPLIPQYNTAEDQARSAELLRKMGVKRLDLFSYVVPD
jgi:pyruvate formate lyase activating enzyme